MIQQSAETLEDIGVLVTRPAQQNQAFIQLLQAQRARAIACPSIEIVPVDIASDSPLTQLEQYDILIFISTNAVKYGLNCIEHLGKSINQPISAIGKSTAQALEQHNIDVTYQPVSGFNSEALLDLEAFQAANINNKNILIFRGIGGRELLADTLKSRGARVNYAEVYKRCRPDTSLQAMQELWSENSIQIITVTSNESLKNLYDMTGEQGRNDLCQTPVVVPSKRCLELAEKLGFKNVLLADSATDQTMLERIKKWHKDTNALE